MTAGQLLVTSGNFRVSDSPGQTLTVTGTSNFVGGTLSINNVGTLSLLGTATFTGTGCSSSPVIQCSGAVGGAGAFGQSAAVVTLVGTAATVQAGAALPHLVLGPTANVVLNNNFTIGGGLSGSGGATGTGTATFVGGGHVQLTGTPNLGCLVAVAKTVATAEVQLNGNVTFGGLQLTTGTLRVADQSAQVLTVNGPATFAGGTLTVNSTGTLALNGPATFLNTACSPSPNIRCADTVGGSGTFANTNGVVTLVGTAEVLAGAALPNLVFASGSSAVLDGDFMVSKDVSGAGSGSGSGKLSLVGASTSTLFGSPTIGCTLEIAKSGTTLARLNGTMTAGQLLVTSGTFLVSDSPGQTLTVTGTSNFVGGTLSINNVGTLSLLGTATFTGTGCSSSPVIQCSGAVGGAGAFGQSAAVVTLVGTAATVQAGAALPHLVLGPTANVVLNNNFTIGGGLSGSGGATGTGTATFVGGGHVQLTGTPNLGCLVAVAKTVATAEVQLNGNVTFGGLQLTTGTLRVADQSAQVLTVNGPATFAGGTLTVNSTGTLALNGPATFLNTACSPSPNIRCADTVGGSGTFANTNGVVTLVGTAEVLAGAALPNLVFASGSSAVLDGDFMVSKDVSGAGSGSGSGKLSLVGASTSTLFGSPTIGCTLEIAKSGTTLARLNGTMTAGQLLVTSGTFLVSDSPGQTLTVTGTSNFVGGTLSINNVGTLSLLGTATFTGTGCSSSPVIQCSGAVGGAGAFGQSAAVVTLVGTAATVQAGAALPHLVLGPTANVVLNDDFMIGGGLSGSGVATGTGTATFVGGGHVQLTGTPNLGCLVAVAKTVATAEVQLNGNVTFGGLQLTSGTLRVADAPTQVLTVNGPATFAGGTLTVNSTGTLALNGPATFLNTACSPSPNIRCANTVGGSGTFADSNGVVTLVGTAEVLAGAALPSLVFASGASAVLDGDFTVAKDVSGVGAGSGAGKLSLVGTSTSTLFGSPTIGCTLEIAKSGATQARLGGTMTAAQLLVTSGTFRVSESSGQTLTVTGASSFVGGTLSVNSVGTLSLLGTATFTGTGCSSSPIIQCAGAVGGAGAFGQSAAVVTLVGTAATVQAGAALPHLVLGPTANVVLNNNFTIGGGLSGSGVATGTGTATFVGGGHVQLTGTPNLGCLVGVAKTAATAEVQLNGNVTFGGLQLTSGTLRVADAPTQVLTVNGPATFAGGTLTVNSTGTLALNGPATFLNTACSPSPNIRCANTVGGSGTFADSNGVVTLVGVAEVLAGAALPHLVFASGSSAVLNSDFTVAKSVSGTGAGSGAGKLSLVGTSTSTLFGSPTIGCTFEIAKTAPAQVDLSGTVNVGQLLVASGIFVVSVNGVFTMTVLGNADFVGGTLTTSSLGTIVVLGDATFTGTACTSSPNIQVAGTVDGLGAFAQSSGVVTLSGQSATVASGAVLPNLTVANGAAAAFAAPFTVNGAMALNATSVTTITATVSVGGNLSGAGVANGSGILRLVGPSTSTLSGTPTIGCTLEIAKTGTAQVDLSGTVNVGQLLVTSGTFVVSVNGAFTMTVAGDANFVGGTLATSSAGTLQIAGAATFLGTTCSSSPNIRCTGTVGGSGAFANSNGVVTLVGAAEVLAGAALPHLVFATGALAVLDADFMVTKSVSGTGAGSGAGRLSLVGTSTSTLSGSPTIGCTFEIAKTAPAQVDLSGTVNVGQLLVTSGTFVVSVNGAFTMTVAGDANFVGGTLATSSVGTLQVAGAATFLGTACSSSPNIRCAGTVGGSGTFADSNGVVTLVGVAEVLAGAALPHLVFASGSSAVLNSDFTVAKSVSGTGAGSGAGKLSLVGTSTSTLFGSPTIGCTFEIAKTAPAQVDLSGTVNVGQLLVASGIFVVSVNGVFTMTVLGNADFVGGTLTTASLGTIAILGTATFLGTVCQNSPNINCLGGVAGAGAFGASSAVVTMSAGTNLLPGAVVPNLRVPAGVVATVTNAAAVNGTLTLTGQLNCNGVLTVLGNVVGAGSIVGTGTLAFGGTSSTSFTNPTNIGCSLEVAKGPGGSLNLDANVNVAGSFTLTSGSFVLSNSNVYTLAVAGAANLAGGTLVKNNLGTMTVAGPLNYSGTTCVGPPNIVAAGPAIFSGGLLAGGGNGVLTLNGDTEFSGTVCTGVGPQIVCTADWTSDANFAPSGGVEGIVFGGMLPQQVNAVSLRNASVSPISFVTFTGATTATGTLITSGVLFVEGSLTVNGFTTVNPPAMMLLGAGQYVFGGDLTANGLFLSSAPVTFSQTATVALGPGAALPTTNIAAPTNSTVTFSSATSSVLGGLNLQSGHLSLPANSTTNVTGDMNLSGGLVDGGTGSVLDVNGSVAITAWTPSSLPRIRCAGNWTSVAAFAPLSNTIELDGTSPTTISAAGGATHVAFSTLLIKNGTRSVVGPSTRLQAAAITVDAGAQLSVVDERTVIRRSSGSCFVTVNGGLFVGAGGTLALGATTIVSVGATGQLSLHGSGSTPATVEDDLGAGYGLTVAGAISAQNFVVRNPGISGLNIQSSASIAPAPFDLRGGTFVGPLAGGPLLTVQRTIPTVLSYLTFEHPAGTPPVGSAYNVSCTAGASVTMRNWFGAFGGAAHENDPGSRVTWAAPQLPAITGLSATPGAAGVTLNWTSVSETDTTGFVVERRPLGGSYVALGELAVLGAGASYAFEDFPFTAISTHEYRVSARLTHNALLPLSGVQAAPSSAVTSPFLVVVGQGGAYPSVNAALSAGVAPFTTIVLARGTHAPFSLNGATVFGVRVIGAVDGEVFIDASTGPVSITGFQDPNHALLSGVVIQSTNGPGLVVSDCSGPVFVDSVDFELPAAIDAVTVSQVAKTVLQRITSTGGISCAATTMQLADVQFGQVALTAGSNVTACEAPSVVTVDGSSVYGLLPGSVPSLDVERYASLSAGLSAQLTMPPGATWALATGLNPNFQQIGFELGFLLDFNTYLPVMIGSADAAGTATFGLALPAPVAAAIQGLTFYWQFLAVPPVGVPRFSNVAPVVVLP